MVKSEKDKGIDGYGEAGDMYRKNKCRKSIYVKGLLVFVLAPPAGYIPRHCRGTPFKRGRCRRDVCNLLFGRYKRASTASPLSRGVRRSRGVCIVKTNAESPYSKRTFCIYAGSASGIHTPPLSWHPFQKGTLPP